jgi:uncharacterized protein YejL (UPF0352 family)
MTERETQVEELIKNVIQVLTQPQEDEELTFITMDQIVKLFPHLWTNGEQE